MATSRLNELKINYGDLKMVTKNFTRDDTQRNYDRVKRLNQGLMI